MDREIPKEIRKKERNKRLSVFQLLLSRLLWLSVFWFPDAYGSEEKDIILSAVDQGTIEVSVSASGKVAPAFEEIITSPINSRIVEVYRRGGDSVDVGTPILKLDLQSTETEYKNCSMKKRWDVINWSSFVSITRRNFLIWLCRLKCLPWSWTGWR